MAAQGIRIGRYKARRLMRQEALVPVWKRKCIHTTDSHHRLPIAENVLDRQFNPPPPNRAFVSDITSTHGDRLAVSGHRTGLVLTESGRLGDGPEYAGSAGL